MEMLLTIKNWSSRNRTFGISFGKLASTSLLVGFSHCFSFAQSNLVPNGSFEVYSTCPTGSLGEINKATPWFQPNYPYAGAGGSSDFFHFCSGESCGSLSQCPRTGIGMAGVCLLFDTTLTDRDKGREYFEVGLTDSMIASRKYCVRFYANLANGSGYGIKQVQAVLTTDSLLYNDPDYSFISGVTPFIESLSIISDTANWVKVETTYTASGGEKFLTLGNFSPGSAVNLTPFGGGATYYLFDDVSVYRQPICFAGNDTTILPGDSVQLGITGEYEPSYSWIPTMWLNNPNIANPISTPTSTITYTLTIIDTNQFACNPILNDFITIWVSGVGIDENGNVTHSGELWPNPAENSCSYKLDLTPKQKGELLLHDVLGRVVQSYTITDQNNKIEMDLSELDSGIYFLKAIINDKLVDSQKLVVQ